MMRPYSDSITTICFYDPANSSKTELCYKSIIK